MKYWTNVGEILNANTNNFMQYGHTKYQIQIQFFFHKKNIFWKVLTVLMSPDSTKHMSIVVKIKEKWYQNLKNISSNTIFIFTEYSQTSKLQMKKFHIFLLVSYPTNPNIINKQYKITITGVYLWTGKKTKIKLNFIFICWKMFKQKFFGNVSPLQKMKKIQHFLFNIHWTFFFLKFKHFSIRNAKHRKEKMFIGLESFEKRKCI